MYVVISFSLGRRSLAEFAKGIIRTMLVETADCLDLHRIDIEPMIASTTRMTTCHLELVGCEHFALTGRDQLTISKRVCDASTSQYHEDPKEVLPSLAPLRGKELGAMQSDNAWSATFRRHDVSIHTSITFASQTHLPRVGELQGPTLSS